MDQALITKTAVCCVAVVGAFVLAGMHVLAGAEAVEFAKWAFVAYVGGATIARFAK